jgi:hypothetical protein
VAAVVVEDTPLVVVDKLVVVDMPVAAAVVDIKAADTSNR